MTIEEIKREIRSTYPLWKATDSSFDGEKVAGIHEVYIQELISNYCESKDYQVQGFPFEKRELGKTKPEYDEDYFTWERYEMYTDYLCLEKEDVLEIKFFYSNTFWPDFISTKDDILQNINCNIKNNLYDEEF
ncbi:hypothetical protein [Flavobacterium ovatum]|uniref:hypothetical protein n=1 Tax=Flavobacterium ovatum TaxID=1928857 RepID=UPI00344EE9C2